ncbi:hypothetical protein ACFLZI_03100 [Nitrospirota bacterium]
MERVTFIKHKGVEILHLNFTSIPPEETFATVDEAKKVISQHPPKSLLTLTDVTDAQVTSDVSNSLRDFVNHNKPYVKAGAVLGVSGVKKVILNSIMRLTGRKLTAFSTMEEAVDWLSEQ